MEQRGCQYLGCEDVGVEHVVIPDEPIPYDVFLYPGHAPYVKGALVDRGPDPLRVAPGHPGGERTRVWVWRGEGADK